MRARVEGTKSFEAVVSKPSVLVIDGVYHMWFSVFDMQSQGYRLAYARSPDGLKWQRAFDAMGLNSEQQDLIFYQNAARIFGLE